MSGSCSLVVIEKFEGSLPEEVEASGASREVTSFRSVLYNPSRLYLHPPSNPCFFFLAVGLNWLATGVSVGLLHANDALVLLIFLFPVAVIKQPSKGHSRGKMSNSAHSSKVQFIMLGEAKAVGFKAIDYITSTIKKQRAAKHDGTCF